MHKRKGQQSDTDKRWDDKTQTSEYELQHKPDSQSFSRDGTPSGDYIAHNARSAKPGATQEALLLTYLPEKSTDCG